MTHAPDAFQLHRAHSVRRLKRERAQLRFTAAFGSCGVVIVCVALMVASKPAWWCLVPILAWSAMLSHERAQLARKGA